MSVAYSYSIQLDTVMNVELPKITSETLLNIEL